LTNEVVTQFETKAEMVEVSLTFLKPREIPPVKADRTLIGRVIANLLSNALRHAPIGGAVVTVNEYRSEGKRVFVSVKDNGDGLEREYYHKIFDKFEQVKVKESGPKVGSGGLGLAFCRMAVEAHGGEIWVESEGKGKGCNFNFTIPV
jgi:signal transduction histidine kinase